MKKIGFIYFALALIASGCSKEQSTGLLDITPDSEVVSFKATFEGEAPDTKLGINKDSGALTWIEGDAIAVQMTDDTFVDFVYNPSTGKFSASLGEKKVKDGGVAYYPAAIASDGTPGSVILPTSYTASVSGSIAKVCPPMVATVKLGDENLALKHLGGILSVRVSYVPADANKLVLTVPGKTITGIFDVTDDADDYISAKAGDGSVTVNFDEGVFNTNATEFFIPVPVTTFTSGFTAAFKNEANETLYTHSTEKTTIEAARASIKRMAELTVPRSLYIRYTEPWKSGETPYAYVYSGDSYITAWPGAQINTGNNYHHNDVVYQRVINDVSTLGVTTADIIVNINNNNESDYPYGDAYRVKKTGLDLTKDVYLSVSPITTRSTARIYLKNVSADGGIYNLQARYTLPNSVFWGWGDFTKYTETIKLGDTLYNYIDIDLSTMSSGSIGLSFGGNWDYQGEYWVTPSASKDVIVTVHDICNQTKNLDFGVASITID